MTDAELLDALAGALRCAEARLEWVQPHEHQRVKALESVKAALLLYEEARKARGAPPEPAPPADEASARDAGKEGT